MNRHNTQTQIEALKALETAADNYRHLLSVTEAERLAIIQQISQVREARERQTEALIERLREAFAAPTCRVDVLGRCTLITDDWLSEFGWRADQVKGVRWKALIHPDDAPVMLSEYHCAIRDCTPYSGEYRVLRNDLKFQMVRTVLRPMSNMIGQYAGAEALVLSV
jgi:PAS domain S-box-containing protein